jgi:hypothetical protein
LAKASATQALTLAALGASLLSLRGDLAPSAAISFLIGTILTIAIAAIVKFALLPQLETFAGLSLALGFVLVPLGAMFAQPWQTGVFLAGVYTFIPVLSPTNEMAYDTLEEYYNFSPAAVAGTLRDFRRLATTPRIPPVDDWIGKVAGRLGALPEQAKLVQ